MTNKSAEKTVWLMFAMRHFAGRKMKDYIISGFKPGSKGLSSQGQDSRPSNIMISEKSGI